MPEHEIPGVSKAPWYRRKWFIELFVSVPPAVAAFLGALKLNADPAAATLALLSFGVFGWLVVAYALKVYVAGLEDKKAGPAVTHEGLRAAMHLLHASVAQACGISIDDAREKLRVTFHRVVPPVAEPDSIEQIVDYVGDDETGRGRRFPVRSGITGMAIRSKKPVVGERANEDEVLYREELQSKWGYTANDVRTMKPGRRSWMAVPVRDRAGQHVLGVVYLDSSEKDLFGNSEHQKAVIVACVGLTRFVGERY